MVNRVHLNVDIVDHFNNVVFDVYRSEQPGVDENDTLVMTLEQGMTLKEKKREVGELLQRNPITPYAFFVKRHYDIEGSIPDVRIGQTPVKPMYLFTIPANKEIEVHSGDEGVYDGRPLYIDYDYYTQPVVDDDVIESGKDYYGPPATGLSFLSNMSYKENIDSGSSDLKWVYEAVTKTFYYRIYARDLNGNRSPWSDELMEQLFDNRVKFIIQYSKDESEWEEVDDTLLQEWVVDHRPSDNPKNVGDLDIMPLSSKRSRIRFENPWYYWKEYERLGGYYRVRAEDEKGAFTDWIQIGVLIIHVKPKELVIRRRLKDGAPSSKEGTDAFTVFTIREEDIDVNKPVIELVDDQLTDKTVYEYTFFYEDVCGLSADPILDTSDHTPWTNMILFRNNKRVDELPEGDFYVSFEMVEETIDIGVTA